MKEQIYVGNNSNQWSQKNILKCTEKSPNDVVSLAHNVSFWAQKPLKWVGKVSGPRN